MSEPDVRRATCPFCGETVEVHLQMRAELVPVSVEWRETLSEREKAVLEEADGAGLIAALAAACSQTKMTPPRVPEKWFLEGMARARKATLPRWALTYLVGQKDALWLAWAIEGVMLLVYKNGGEHSVAAALPAWVVNQGNEEDLETFLNQTRFRVADANWDFIRGV